MTVTGYHVFPDFSQTTDAIMWTDEQLLCTETYLQKYASRVSIFPPMNLSFFANYFCIARFPL